KGDIFIESERGHSQRVTTAKPCKDFVRNFVENFVGLECRNGTADEACDKVADKDEAREYPDVGRRSSSP
ncbi:MAG TPA: hypothetical protein PLK78_13685, partial [Verrucomicrobiota bacterium]|nr:hypothetical protein [Verrucomicrobiota bacterium]